MRKLLFILLAHCSLLLTSCSIHETVEYDTPGFVTYTITGDHIHLQIHSDQSSVTLTHTVGEWSGELIIQSQYYDCISLAIDTGSEIDITDGHALFHLDHSIIP